MTLSRLTTPAPLSDELAADVESELARYEAARPDGVGGALRRLLAAGLGWWVARHLVLRDDILHRPDPGPPPARAGEGQGKRVAPWVRGMRSCRWCGGTGFLVRETWGEDGSLDSGARRCEHCKGVERGDPMETAGVPPFLRGYRWDLMNGHQQEVHRRAKTALAAGFDVLLLGSNGVGKTGVGITLLQGEAEDHNTIGFVAAPDLMSRLRDSYDQSERLRREGVTPPSEEEILQGYVAPYLLLLDDLGAEHLTDWTRSMVFLLLYRRHAAGRRTVITTNLGIDERPDPARPSPMMQHYGSRIVSRLEEFRWVAFKEGAESRRRERRERRTAR